MKKHAYVIRRIKIAHDYAQYPFKDGYKSFPTLDEEWSNTIEGYQFINCVILIKNEYNHIIQTITDHSRFLIIRKLIGKNQEKVISVCNESLSVPYLDIPIDTKFLGENGEPVELPNLFFDKISYTKGIIGVVTEINNDFIIENTKFSAIFDPERIELIDELEIRIDLRDLIQKIGKNDKIYVYLPVKFGDKKSGAVLLTALI